MALTEEKAVRAHCDKNGCRSVRWGSADELPVGFHGTVKRVWESDESGEPGGEVGDVMSTETEWFACKEPHINGAVTAALERDSGDNLTNLSQRKRELKTSVFGNAKAAVS
jgi:hypothetical protein